MTVGFERTTIDRLYVWLSGFTNLYLVLIAIEFFAVLHESYPILERLLDAFSEPYLGALAVYTVLKEIRKRGASDYRSRHRGEWFVVAWLVLLIVTTFTVVLSARYRFDLIYQLIIANSLAAFMVYLGSRIHRP